MAAGPTGDGCGGVMGTTIVCCSVIYLESHMTSCSGFCIISLKIYI